MTNKEQLKRLEKQMCDLVEKIAQEENNTPRPGFWFKSTEKDNHFCVYVKEQNGEVFSYYGWDSMGEWGVWGTGNFYNKPHYELVNDSEIEQRMFNELEKRGFKAGVKIDRDGLDSSYISDRLATINCFDKKRVDVSIKNRSVIFLDGVVVFAKGVFAEIEIDSLDIKGHKLEIEKGSGYVKFGCKRFGDNCVETLEKEIREFNIDCSTDLKIESIVLEGGVEVDTKDLATIMKVLKKHRNEKS